VAAERTADIYSPEPNILERKAADYLAHGADGTAEVGDAQRARVVLIARATWWVVGLSAVAGIISGGIIGGSEVWLRLTVIDDDEAGLLDHWQIWAWFFAFAGLVSAIEIAFLYWISLRSVVRIACLSGLELGHSGYPALFARGLARGALEFPNPQVEVVGIDPYALVPRWQLALLGVTYRMKVGVSSFVLRVFLRRVAARMAVRGFVPLIAGPLYAAWNAYIIWRIMTEARIRTLGPFAVDALVAEVKQHDHGDDADAFQDVMLHGAGEMLVRGRDAHPNRFYLMFRLREAFHHEADIRLDWDRQIARLKDLDVDAQSLVLDVLTLGAILGSKLRREEKDMLQQASTACGKTFHPERLKNLSLRLRKGHKIDHDELASARD
jgi:hypothetical protein